MNENDLIQRLASLSTQFDETIRSKELLGVSRPPKGARQDSEAPISAIALSGEIERATPSYPYVAPIVVVCEHSGFGGAQWRTSNGWLYVGDGWNDRISSIIVVSGKWRFYEHSNYGGASWELGPGYYANLSTVNIPNDTISSFKPISW